MGLSEVFLSDSLILESVISGGVVFTLWKITGSLKAKNDVNESRIDGVVELVKEQTKHNKKLETVLHRHDKEIEVDRTKFNQGMDRLLEGIQAIAEMSSSNSVAIARNEVAEMHSKERMDELVIVVNKIRERA